MLSIAYAEDQLDGMQIHHPEVCYPAQGFHLDNKTNGIVELDDLHRLKVKILELNLGNQRYEPVTYWATIGDDAITNGTEKKLIEPRYGLRGLIPDGMLIRVSSIDRDSNNAFCDTRRLFRRCTNPFRLRRGRN